MATSFDDWLAELRASGNGPVTFHARRGVVFGTNLYFPGDLTGATMRGQVRLGPDVAGTPLATFNVSAPAIVGAQSVFNVALAAADVTALPAATVGEGSATFAYDLLITLSGGNEELLWGGPFIVTGRITV